MTLDLLGKFLGGKFVNRLFERSVMLGDVMTVHIDQKLLLEHDQHVTR